MRDAVILVLSFSYAGGTKRRSLQPVMSRSHTVTLPPVVYPTSLSSSPSSANSHSPVTPSPLVCYADYLIALYSSRPLAADDDKGLPTPSDVFIRLALVKKEQVSKGEADAFTRLTLNGDVDEILKVKQPIAIEDVMTLDENINLVVVEGAPGIGKSTLAWELCRQWPTLQSMKRFSLVVLLRLREEGVQASKTISDLFPYPDRPGVSMIVGDKMEEQLGENVLFVFDGYDELPAELRKTESLIMKVIRGLSLPKATVLLTSRPSATREFLPSCKSYKHIEVVGFSENEIVNYSESVFEHGSELLRCFNNYLSDNPIVKGLMYNPLNCGIVVTTYRQNFSSMRPIPRTLTQLYTELCLCLLSRHLNAVEDPMADNLPDQLKDIPEPLHIQLVCLGKLAFEGRVDNQVIFKQLPGGCSELGLLNSYTELYGRKRKTYNFLHVTLQEYFGAFYISQLPGDRQQKLFAEYGGLDHLSMVWRFLSGLTQMKAIGWEVFKNWKVTNNDYGYRTKENGKEVCVQPSVVQCLYEAQDAESCTHVFGHSSVTYLHRGGTTPSDAYAVGYCVSACRNSNAWNVHLSLNGLGPELVEMFVCGLKSDDCGSGFVEMLDLSGNSINEGLVVHLNQMPPPQNLQRIKKIDLYVCELTQTGFDILADLIPFLPSLISLNINENPGGGNGSIVKLLKALGGHTTIEDIDVRDIGIGNLDVNALSEVVKPSGSLKDLKIGTTGDKCNEFSPETWQLLVRTVLSHSSLTRLRLHVPRSFSPLEHIETISDSLSFLEIVKMEVNEVHTTAPSARTTALANALKSNTTLKHLHLDIPLKREEVLEIVESLNQNSIRTLQLNEKYFSKTEINTLDNPKIRWWGL